MAMCLPPVGDKLIVKGIPASLYPDKISIYFLKCQSGGGDVLSVTFPILSSEPDTAVVAFDDPRTVLSVLAVENHKIGGNNVIISAVMPEPDIFDSVTATVSDSIIHSIISNGKSEEFFHYVEDSTGCVVECQGSEYTVKGKLYQVQAAFDRFQDATSDPTERLSQQSLNEYMTSLSHAYQVTKTESVEETHLTSQTTSSSSARTPTPVSRKKAAVSTVLDKDLYAFMELTCSSEFNVIRVLFDPEILGDMVKITLAPKSHDAEPQKALKALGELYAKVEKIVAQDKIKIAEDFPGAELDRIFSILRPEFPDVHMSKITNNRVKFVASDIVKCNMAKGMFEALYQIAKQPSPGSKYHPTKQPVSVVFDKDMYGYTKLAFSSEMDTIRDQFKVSFNTKIILKTDTAQIEITANSRDSDPLKASKALQKLVYQVETTAARDDVEIDKDFPADVLERIFSNLRPQLPKVHVDRMDCNHVIFVAESNATCQVAKDLFQAYSNREKQSVHGGKSSPTRQPVTVIFDKDVYGYMKLACSSEMEKIRNQFKVSFNTKIVNESANVEITANSRDADPLKASKALEKLVSQVERTAVRNDVEIDKDFPADALERIFSDLRPELPKVYMDSMGHGSNRVIFLAEKNATCRMAKDLFKVYYDKVKQFVYGGKSSLTRQPVTVIFDKDVYGYMKLACSSEMEKIRNQFKVSFNTKIVNESANIEITANSRDADPLKASKALEKLVSQVERTAVRDDVEIDKDFPADALERIFSGLRPELPKVHVDSMGCGSNRVRSVAESNVFWRMAKDLFEVYYDKEKEELHATKSLLLCKSTGSLLTVFISLPLEDSSERWYWWHLGKMGHDEERTRAQDWVDTAEERKLRMCKVFIYWLQLLVT